MKRNSNPPKRALLQVLTVLIFAAIHSSSQAQVNWTGAISSSFYEKKNWSDTTINYSNLTAYTLVIGTGNPNNCIYTGSNNTSNTSQRVNFLNTKKTALFTVNGSLYCWNSDSLNGNIILNSGADFNIRNYGYIGRNSSGAAFTQKSGTFSTRNGTYIGHGTSGSSATVNVSGGVFRTDGLLTIANGTGLSGQLNITGGTVHVTGNLTIGSSGKISLSGIGTLTLTGDKTSAVNALVTAGKISAPAGKTLSVTYNGTLTTVMLAQNPNSMLTEYSSYIIMKNSTLEVKVDKATSNILSYKFNGVEMVNTQGSNHLGAYYDFTTSAGFETINGCTFSVKTDTNDILDVSFKRPYSPGNNITPCDADIHFVMKKDVPGLYTYSILEHQASYLAFDLGSWRQILWLSADPNNTNNHLLENIYTDSLRSGPMPTIYDEQQAAQTEIGEILLIRTGKLAGTYDGKYEYSMSFWENPVWGHASDINKMGLWFINPSAEYFGSGPTYHDLNAAADIIHNCLNGTHYGANNFIAAQGEYWTKIYGPFLIYASSKNTGAENWADAKARLETEKGQWPYSWLTNTSQYPLAAQRGTVTGKLTITDPFKPAVKGSNAWVGLTILSNDAKGQWQFEDKNYQHWAKTDANGNFTISNIRPGTYTFFAFTNGETGEYSQSNVQVTANAITALGDVKWNIARNNGNLLWEIGVPDRTSKEFKFGDYEFSQGFAHKKFKETFPSIIEYDVAGKDWANKLCYAHTGYPITDSTQTSWKWRLNFSLPSGMPTTGNATLTIAYASNDHAAQYVYVNNENSPFANFYPENGGGNGFLRQTNYTKYFLKTISIPMSRLKAGANTITLLMPSTSAIGNHVMYDYISLEAPVVLPVKLVSFKGSANNNVVNLKWTTASEQNNSHYEIEKSIDGSVFKRIGIVKGNGTTQLTNNYTFSDDSPVIGNNYYRLLQYDNNGTRTEQGVELVRFNLYTDAAIKIYPNPSQGEFTLSTPAISEENIILSVHDLSGRLIYKSNMEAGPDGTIFVKLPQKPAPGEYVLKISTGDKRIIHQKIIFR